MKKTACLLVLLGLMNCQRDKDITPKVLQLLEGKWEQTGHQTRVNGETVWMADSTNGNPDLIFRADGVPLDGNGEGMCCSPKNYLLNGKLYAIEPKSPVELAGICINSLCAPCKTVELQATKSALLWNYCGIYQATYRKLP